MELYELRARGKGAGAVGPDGVETQTQAQTQPQKQKKKQPRPSRLDVIEEEEEEEDEEEEAEEEGEEEDEEEEGGEGKEKRGKEGITDEAYAEIMEAINTGHAVFIANGKLEGKALVPTEEEERRDQAKKGRKRKVGVDNPVAEGTRRSTRRKT